MKLIECYIENFGKISDRKYTFNDGFNCFVADNGTGKTTLSVFIKVMLYGMGDTKKPSILENDRKHYLPWQGGVCGGTLTFSVGAKKYRIERTFSQKASEDSFTLYDLTLGRPTSDIPEPIGESLFGIDREGFERTVFLSERYLLPSSDNKSVSAKLSDLVGSDGDIGVMDDAMKILENQRKFYQKKGGVGEIANIKEEIYRCEDELSQLDRREAELAVEEEKLRSLDSEIKKAKKAARLLSDRREMAVIAKANEDSEARRKRLSQALREDNARRDALIEFFGGNIPTFEEIDEASYKATEARRQSEGAEYREGGEYTELSALFSVGISPYEIENASLALSRARSATEKKNDADSAIYRQKFTKRVPSKDELDNLIDEVENSRKNVKNVNFTLLFVGILLIIGGIALGVFVSELCFIISLLGAVLFAFALLSGARKRVALDKKLGEFFSSLSDKRTPNDAAAELAEMKALLLRGEPCAEPDASDMKILFDLCERLSYRGEDIFGAVEEIIGKYRLYERLSFQEEFRRSEGEQRQKRAEALQGEADVFISRFKVTGENPFEEIRSRLLDYNRLTERLVETRRELAEYSNSRITELGRTEIASLEEIDSRAKSVDDELGELLRRYAVVERGCKAIAEELEGRDVIIARKEECEEKLKRYTDNYNTILLAKKYLTDAKDAVTSKYIGKTKESFERYASMIGSFEGEYDMDTSFAVSKREGAKARSVEAYSKGTRDIFNIAARFALIDSLYENEEPIVILDDPFISLDDTKTRAALELIKKISEMKQVIYFTCSKSRSI